MMKNRPQKTANLLLVILLLMAGCRSAAQPDDIHDFRLETFNHGRFYLNEHIGRPVVMVFWATYCGICKQQLIDLNQFVKDVPKDKTTVVSVCIDPENHGDMARSISGISPVYPVLLDTDGKLFKKWGLTTMPSTVVIDKEGKKCLTLSGYTPHIKNQLKAYMLRLTDQENAK